MIIKSPLFWILISALLLFLISIYKKLYGYIIKEHLLPFFLSIFVMIFILLAQFLIKNIDKFLGKDLGIGLLFEMVYYNMAWVIALAIPMAILVCTLMAFGRLSSDNEIVEINYPVNEYPEKVKSLSFVKLDEIAGLLWGIKGQYLIFDDGTVLNIRKHTGYLISLEV